MDSFPLAHKDIMSTMADDLDLKAEELAKKKVGELLGGVDLEQVVTVDRRMNAILIGGRPAEEGLLNTLRSEVEFLLSSEIWKLIQETPKKLAERALFLEGENMDSLIKGRAILYTLSTQENIVNKLRDYVKKWELPTAWFDRMWYNNGAIAI